MNFAAGSFESGRSRALEGFTARRKYDDVLRHTKRQWTAGVNSCANKRARTLKLTARPDHVAQRQWEKLNRQFRSGVECNQCAAARHKFLHAFDAVNADAAGIFRTLDDDAVVADLPVASSASFAVASSVQNRISRLSGKNQGIE